MQSSNLRKKMGEVLRLYRKQAGYRNQKQVAVKLGSKKYHGKISRMETGHGGSIEYIEKLLILYDKSEAQFLNDVVALYLSKKSSQ